MVNPSYLCMLNLLSIFLAIAPALSDARNLPEHEYIAMKRHIESLNKPAVKSIKTENGDIFDCIDIYKQPAFDHPLLKDHKIQMKPSLVQHIRDAPSSDKAMDIGLPDGGCPDGSVPIRRLSMQDLIRADSISSFGQKYVQLGSPLNTPNPKVARLSTLKDDFYGLLVRINVWKPNVGGNGKFSTAQFWMANGPPAEANIIEAGWMVNEKLFSDNESRLFTSWTVDGYNKTGCLNLLCPGFVQLNPTLPVGLRLEPSTIDQTELTVGIIPDKKGWYLVAKGLQVVIGYWPRELFTHMTDKAEVVQYGAEVYSPREDDLPPMGSGRWPEEGHGKACYLRDFKVVVNFNEFVPAPTNMTLQVDKPKCYRLMNKGDAGLHGVRGFYVGGPGGNCEFAT